MSAGIWFWLIFVLSFVFGGFWGWTTLTPVFLGGGLIIFILIGLLGWGIFGSPLK